MQQQQVRACVSWVLTRPLMDEDEANFGRDQRRRRALRRWRLRLPLTSTVLLDCLVSLHGIKCCRCSPGPRHAPLMRANGRQHHSVVPLGASSGALHAPNPGRSGTGLCLPRVLLGILQIISGARRPQEFRNAAGGPRSRPAAPAGGARLPARAASLPAARAAVLEPLPTLRGRARLLAVQPLWRADPGRQAHGAAHLQEAQPAGALPRRCISVAAAAAAAPCCSCLAPVPA